MYIKLRKVFVHTLLNHPVQHEEMSKGRRVYSFSQGMHIVLDTECSLYTGCPQIT